MGKGKEGKKEGMDKERCVEEDGMRKDGWQIRKNPDFVGMKRTEWADA